MRRLALMGAFGLVMGLGLTAPAAAGAADAASDRDIQRLHEDLANLDAALAAIDPGDRQADAFRTRADEIREEAIYIKVKLRHQQRSNGPAVTYEEVAAVRRDIRDLRDDLDRAFRGASARDVPGQLEAGTRILVRLEETLSSATARREDRFEAVIHLPVRSGDEIVIPAGARVRGIVMAAEPAQRPSKSGQLELEFDRLYLDRQSLDIRGRVSAVGEEENKEKAQKAGIGAAIGGVLGGILGGKKGAILGVLLGGGGAIVGTKGDEAELPAGTILTVRLEEPLTVPRR